MKAATPIKVGKLWGASKHLALKLLVAITVIFLLLPILILIPVSFSSAQYLRFPPPGFSLQWYQELLHRPEWIRSVWVSLQVAILTTVFCLLLGVSASFAMVRGRFVGKTPVYALILAPMILPHVIIALGLFFLFSKLNIAGSVLAIALGHTTVFVSIVVIIVSSTLQSFDRRLEQAAIIFGASPLRAFLRVTLPIIAPGVWSAALFSFLLSFDELLIALFLSDPTTITLPIQIWNNTVLQVSPTIAAVSVLLVGLSILTLAGTNLARKKSTNKLEE